METNFKQNYGSAIEQVILDIQDNGKDKNNDKLLKELENQLNIAFKREGMLCIKANIMDKNEDFYGASVYLSHVSLKEFVQLIYNGTDSKTITKKLMNQKITYVVELDPNMLFDAFTKFTPGEIVGVLLHEIGHVKHDTDFYNDLVFAYRKAFFNLQHEKGDLSKFKYSSKQCQILSIYILKSIMDTNVIHNVDYEKVLRGETIADRFAVLCGYQGELRNALIKIDKKYLSKLKKNRDDAIESNAEEIVRLQDMLKTRKKLLRRSMLKTITETPSKFVREMIDKIFDRNKLLCETGNIAPMSEMVEVIPTPFTHCLQENFFSCLKRSPVGITQEDIDQLTIQIAQIEDYDDKSICVYKIHKRLTQVAKAKDDLGKGDCRYSICVNYEKQLQKLLANALKKEIVPKTYGVFIKYPKGYEG